MNARKAGEMKLRLHRAIKKNWLLGIVCGVVFILSGYRKVGFGVMTGGALWNLFLYGNLVWLQRGSPRIAADR